MDNIFEILVAVIFIVASVWSEIKKQTPNQTGGSPDDLGSIDDFFKNQAPGANTGPDSPSTPSARDPYSIEAAADGETFGLAEHQDSSGTTDLEAWGAPDLEQAFGSSVPEPNASPRRRKKRKHRSSALPDHSSPYDDRQSEGGIDYDEAPALTNQFPVESSFSTEAEGEEGACALGLGSHAEQRATSRPAPRLRFTRLQIRDSMILHMILERYDINRAINRLSRRPGQM